MTRHGFGLTGKYDHLREVCGSDTLHPYSQEMAFLLITAFVADDAYSFPGIGKMWVFHWPFCKDPLFLCFGFNFGIGGNVGFYGFRSVGSPPGAL